MEERLITSDLILMGRQNEMVIFSLEGAKFQPIGAYKGKWDIQIYPEGQVLKLVAYPLISDSQVYVMAPDVAPIKWRVYFTGDEGTETQQLVKPKGAILFYNNSDYSILSSVPIPSTHVSYSIRLVDATTGQTLKKTHISN